MTNIEIMESLIAASAGEAPSSVQDLLQKARAKKVCGIARSVQKDPRWYILFLAGVPEVKTPVGIDENHGCHLYVIRLDLDRLTCDREGFRKLLAEKYQVGTAVHYPAVWTWEAAATFAYDKSDCPHTDRVCRSVVTLPVFPSTSEADLHYLAWAVKDAAAQVRK